jgi:hypothetical protein
MAALRSPGRADTGSGSSSSNRTICSPGYASSYTPARWQRTAGALAADFQGQSGCKSASRHMIAALRRSANLMFSSARSGPYVFYGPYYRQETRVMATLRLPAPSCYSYATKQGPRPQFSAAAEFSCAANLTSATNAQRQQDQCGHRQAQARRGGCALAATCAATVLRCASAPAAYADPYVCGGCCSSPSTGSGMVRFYLDRQSVHARCGLPLQHRT